MQRSQVRVLALTDPKILEPQPELFIRLIPDKDANTLSIVDSGIGMTKADLVDSLGALRACGGCRGILHMAMLLSTVFSICMSLASLDKSLGAVCA